MELSFLRKQVYYGEEAQPRKQPLPNTKDNFFEYLVLTPSVLTPSTSLRYV